MINVKLNQSQKDQIIARMNPPGSNPKNVNWFNVVNYDEEHDSFKVEVGFWITHLNCKPRYQKDFINIIFKKEPELCKGCDQETCKCGATVIVDEKGNFAD